MSFSATGGTAPQELRRESRSKLANRFDNMANVMFHCQSLLPSLPIAQALPRLRKRFAGTSSSLSF
jgi:hypothetical protein